MQPVLRSRTVRRVIALSVLAAVAASGLVFTASPAAAAPAVTTPAGGCQSVTALTNGGFETPVIADNSYQIIPSAHVPGWETTDPAGIEIWGHGFNGVLAAAGRQYAELNATQSGTLFQEVATQPGQSLQWSLLHRGRGGVDTMDVLIGAPGGELVSQGNLSDDTAAWGRHTGLYTVPAGQTVTRFGFRAVSTGSGSASIGNFLDDISFGTGACVVVTSDVANVSVPGGAVHVGDTLEYAVTAHNQGGSAASLAELRNVLPAGIEFVAGSLRTAVGPLVGSKTDASADDQAEYDVATRTIVARLGAGATGTAGGSIAAQEWSTFVFRAIVTPAASLAQLVSAPTVDSTDSLSGIRTTSAAAATITPVASAADLVVTHTANTPAPVAGSAEPARFTATIANAGPQDDVGVVARVTPPAGLAAVSVTLDDGSVCALTSGVAECAIGVLTVGSSRSAVIAGLVDQSIPGGTVLTGTVSALGDVYDREPANDGAAASATVITESDVWITAISPDGPIRTGEDAVFEFTAGNAGPSAITGLEIEVTVPEGAVVSPSMGTFDPASGRWSVPALASRAESTLRVVRQATEEGTMWSRARVLASSAVDADGSNEDVTAEVEVQRIALLVPPVVPDVSEDPVVVPDVAAANIALSAQALAATGAEADRGALLATLLLFGGLLVLAARRHVGSARRR